MILPTLIPLAILGLTAHFSAVVLGERGPVV